MQEGFLEGATSELRLENEGAFWGGGRPLRAALPGVRAGCAGRHGKPGGGLGRREWLSSGAGFADRRLSLPQQPASHEASSRLCRILVFAGALWGTSRVGDPLYTSHVHKQGWHNTGSQGTRGTEQLGPRQTGLSVSRSGSPSQARLGGWGCLAGQVARRRRTAGSSPCVTQEVREAAPLLWIQGPEGCRRAGSLRSLWGGAALSGA